MNASRTKDNHAMKPVHQKDVHQKERIRSDAYILNQRLKNRERQRRYRARKRQEAEMQKSDVLSQSEMLQVELQLKRNSNNEVVRTHCKRNWKKDARAHAGKCLKERLSAEIISEQTLEVERQTLCWAAGIIKDLQSEKKLHLENSLSLSTAEDKDVQDLKRLESAS